MVADDFNHRGSKSANWKFAQQTYRIADAGMEGRNYPLVPYPRILRTGLYTYRIADAGMEGRNYPLVPYTQILRTGLYTYHISDAGMVGRNYPLVPYTQILRTGLYTYRISDAGMVGMSCPGSYEPGYIHIAWLMLSIWYHVRYKL